MARADVEVMGLSERDQTMPSPVGHSLMGYIIYRAAVGSNTVERWSLIALCVFAANAADLDFLPGLLVGDPGRYHHGPSHSLGFAVLFALACSFLLLLFKRAAIGWNFTIFFALYSSHIALDYLSIDTTAPYGVPLLWPLSDAYYIAPFAFLPGIRRAATSIEFIPSLFSLHNLWAASVECLLLLPFLLLFLAFRGQTRVLPE